MTGTKSRATYLLKSVLISYLSTLFLLLFISFIMLLTGMSTGATSIAVIITYVVSAFSGSFYMGKHVEQKRYIWGLIVALIYFMIYILISLMTNQDTSIQFFEYVQTFFIVVCSGMLGGMLS